MSETVSPYPYSYDSEKADEIWATLCATEGGLLLGDANKDVCAVLFGNSPFLAAIAERQPEEAARLISMPASQSFDTLVSKLEAPRPENETTDDFSAFLRRCKSKLSLLVAKADVACEWTLSQVTEALSKFADTAVSLALAHLIHEQMRRGALPWPSGAPEPVTPELCKNTGYFILGMGKLGAYELNYSSDIDLIALYEPNAIAYSGRKTLSHCWIKITQELVKLIDKRTMHGYVFRTDLRLRPDPGATPVAIAVDAAESYYHSMAVNWERSAMIKARVIAGDQLAGQRYLENLSSWVWRRNMDFAALKDIAAIKNQINRHYDQERSVGPEYNVKLGIGGIREIEFFAQVNQLLHAGRHPSLRIRGTLAALRELKHLDLLSEKDCQTLENAYVYLRQLEHRIQMVDDAQCHELPSSAEDYRRISMFMRHDTPKQMTDALVMHTTAVSRLYDGLLPDYSGTDTSGFSEKELPQTLERLKFTDSAGTAALIEGWRRGRHLALRTERAKALLEQCLPKLLQAFGDTENPGAALARFDKFVSQLPTGVQLFSLLHANPSLFTLLARVMGLAPALAETLSKKPELWDMVLEPSFYSPLETEEFLTDDLAIRLGAARDFQDILDFVRKFVAEQKFRIGVHLLESLADVRESGEALTRVADVALKALIPHVSSELARRHGIFEDGGIAVLAMGKYGGGELTHTSDLDIVFLYHADDMSKTSNGDKPLMPSQYFSRLAQNIITAVTALTSEGRLFEVDTRLRPSGSQGPLVVTLKTFQEYYAQSAWTWEHMALTRARIITAPDAMVSKLKESVEKVLIQTRDPSELVQAVHEMRGKLFQQFGSRNKWAIKHCQGGLVDMEFICQYLMLKEGYSHPEIFEPELTSAIAKLSQYGLLTAQNAELLEEAHQLMQKCQSLLRLSIGRSPEKTDEIPSGLKQILLKATSTKTIEELEDRLERYQQAIYKLYQTLIETPATQTRKSGED